MPDIGLSDTLAQTEPTQPARRVDTVEAVAEFAQGDTIGRYEIVRVVGAGGMGVVYAGYDAMLERTLAIKVLRPDVWSEEQADVNKLRLLREAQTMAKLSHPNITAVYEAGTVDGRIYLAMEYVDGVTLDKWLDTQPSSAEILDALIQAGKGLAASHRAGVIHRDFKPGNILVGKDGRVRVTDFGLARPAVPVEQLDVQAPVDADEILEWLKRHPELTRTGAFMGTPAYMAPDQFLGQPADEASDQFSFCLVVFEAVYGRRLPTSDIVSVLFDTRATRNGQASSVAADNGPVPEASRLQSKAVVKGSLDKTSGRQRVPRWLRHILRRGLSPVPAERYPSMDRLLEDLERGPQRVRRLVGVAALVTVIAVVAGLFFSGVFASSKQVAAPRCDVAMDRLAGVWDDDTRAGVEQAFLALDKPFARTTFAGVSRVLDDYANAWASAYVDTCEATHVRHEQSEDILTLRMMCLDGHRGELAALTGFLRRADERTVENAFDAANALSDISECSDVPVLLGRDPPPEEPEAQAELDAVRTSVARAEALFRLGSYKQALVEIAPAAERARALGYQPLLAEALFVRGVIEWRSGDLGAGVATLKQSAAVAEASRSDLIKTEARIELVHVVGYEQARVDEALEFATVAEASLHRIGNNRALRAQLEFNIGSVLHRRGDHEKQRDKFAHALALWREAFGDEHPSVALAHGGLGSAYLALSQPDKALEHHEQALALRSRILGDEHPMVAESINNLGNVFMVKGDVEKAREYYQRAHDLWVAALGPEHPSVAVALANLGNILVAEQEFERALEYYQKALAIEKRALGPNHPNVVVSLNNIGVVLGHLERYDQSLQHFEQAIAIAERTLRPEHPLMAETLANYGDALVALGEGQKAVAPLERAVLIMAENAAPDTARAHTEFALANALFDTGDSERARDLAERARAVLAAAEDPEAAEIDEWLADLP